MIQSWKDFTAHCGKLVTHPGGRYTKGKDLSVLLSLAASRLPRRVLEFGTAYGDTAVALARHLPEAKIHTFDISLEDRGPGMDRGNAHEVLPRAEVGIAIREANLEMQGRVRYVVDKGDLLANWVRASAPYDVAFIDGNHSWRYVSNDTKLALETLNEGGILVWDDYWPACVEIMRFIDTLNGRAGDPIVMVEGTRMCYIHLIKDRRARLIRAVADL